MSLLCRFMAMQNDILDFEEILLLPIICHIDVRSRRHENRLSVFELGIISLHYTETAPLDLCDMSPCTLKLTVQR
jgi:hypothetical protein